jgi:hypothetical protein
VFAAAVLNLRFNDVIDRQRPEEVLVAADAELPGRMRGNDRQRLEPAQANRDVLDQRDRQVIAILLPTFAGGRIVTFGQPARAEMLGDDALAVSWRGGSRS